MWAGQDPIFAHADQIEDRPECSERPTPEQDRGHHHDAINNNIGV
jgi:hypothetical protein